MERRTILKGGAALGLAAGLAPRTLLAADPVKVGFMLVGPKNDTGWSQHHYDAAMKAKEKLGDGVELMVQESVAEGADAERVMSQMALGGAKLIFATSFGYMDSVQNVAAKFPKVMFEHATGYKTAPNASAYNARFYEGRAVCGYIAGKMTKTNKIGYIGSFPIPEVVQGIDSSFVNARKANPKVEIAVVMISTWFDPAKEADATKALLDQGCDVVLAHTDSTAPLPALKAAGKFGFGQSSDMAEFAPAPRLSSIIDNWAPYYEERIKAVIDGTWKSQNVWYGIKEGMVGIGEISDAVPADVKAEAEKIRDGIAGGTVHAFQGPLNKQDGSVWLKDGELPDDGTLAGMNFFVEGITTKMPS